MRCSLLRWLPFAAALEMQLERIENLQATLERHEEESELRMTWPPTWNYSAAAVQVDAFLAPRADWRVASEPWENADILRLVRPIGPLQPLLKAFAAEWKARQWGAGVCDEGFIQVAAPTVLGPWVIGSLVSGPKSLLFWIAQKGADHTLGSVSRQSGFLRKALLECSELLSDLRSHLRARWFDALRAHHPLSSSNSGRVGQDRP